MPRAKAGGRKKTKEKKEAALDVSSEVEEVNNAAAEVETEAETSEVAAEETTQQEEPVQMETTSEPTPDPPAADPSEAAPVEMKDENKEAVINEEESNMEVSDQKEETKMDGSAQQDASNNSNSHDNDRRGDRDDHRFSPRRMDYNPFPHDIELPPLPEELKNINFGDLEKEETKPLKPHKFPNFSGMSLKGIFILHSLCTKGSVILFVIFALH